MNNETVEFDLLAHNYDEVHAENIKLSGYPTAYFDEYKIKEIGRSLAQWRRQNDILRFLNFGCGIGKSEKFIRKYIPNSKIYGADVSPESLAVAREKNKDLNDVYFEKFDGKSIPFITTFDVIFVANVFHHIPREQHMAMLKKLFDALDPNGFLFLFEHNPLNPVTVRTIKACPFDQNAELLSPLYTNRILKESGFSHRRIRFTIFFPKILSFLLPIEKYLTKMPMGAQYYFLARKNK